jgi:group I intron endonuclease
VHLKNTNIPLQRAIIKYGIQNISFHIVEFIDGIVDKDHKLNNIKLLERESFFILSLKPIYNILSFAGSSLGYKHTIETRDNMKINYSQERKNTIGNLNKGKTLSEDTKTKISLRAIARYSDKDYKDQFLNNDKLKLFKGKNVVLINNTGEILSEYTSIQQVNQVFSCDRKTVRKYINNGKLFKNLGYLKINITKET